MFFRSRELLISFSKTRAFSLVRYSATLARSKRHERRTTPRPGPQVNDTVWAEPRRERKRKRDARLDSEPRLVKKHLALDSSKGDAAVKRSATPVVGPSHEAMNADIQVPSPEAINDVETRFTNNAGLQTGTDHVEARLHDDKIDGRALTLDTLAASDDDLTNPGMANGEAAEPDSSYVDIDMLDTELQTSNADTPVAPMVSQAIPTATQSIVTDRYDRNPEPRFRIPAAKWQFLTANGTASLQGHWSYELYRDAAGNQPKVHYCKTLAESEACAKLFLDEEIIGFDMEWKPSYHKKRSEAALAEEKIPWHEVIKKNASLIQLGSETDIGLFHIASHPGTRVSELMAPSLKRVLQSPNILKTGVNILNADGKRVQTYLGVKCRGLFELGHLNNIIDTAATNPEQKFAGKGLTSLAKLTLKHLHLPLSKGSVRCSNWSKPLTLAQVRYSASDAYVGYHLFRAMNSQRLALDHEPPLPPFAERCLPIPMRRPEAHAVPVKPSPAAPDMPMTRKSPIETEARLEKRREADTAQRSGNTLDPRIVLDQECALAFNHLRVRRAKIAADKNIAEYHIAHDKTLHDIARLRPGRLQDLTTVRGLGKRNLELYGQEWIQVMNETHIFIKKARAMGRSPGSVSTHPPDTSRPARVTAVDSDQVLHDPARTTGDSKSARAPARSAESLSGPAIEDIWAPEPITTANPRQAASPESHIRILQDQREGRILSVLTGLRSQLARKAGVLRTDIVSDQALNEVAKLKAKNDLEVESMDGFMQLHKFASYWGTSLSDFIARYDMPAEPSVPPPKDKHEKASLSGADHNAEPRPAQDGVSHGEHFRRPSFLRRSERGKT